jgi:AGCS family alanine or glycine:cation symporter
MLILQTSHWHIRNMLVVTVSFHSFRAMSSLNPTRKRYFSAFVRGLFLLLAMLPLHARAAEKSWADQLTDKINGPIEALTDWLFSIVFWGPKFDVLGSVPLVLILLAGTSIFLTLWFGFINIRAFGTAIKTVRGKYTRPDAPGEISHFQALSSALSATVGLGNIAGVAIAIGIGGPGATLWMIILGICGMTTKFAECTLGVRYRKIDKSGKAHGGAMYYLTRGLSDGKTGGAKKFFKGLGWTLAILFSIAAIGGALGAGNLFQSNQAYSLFAKQFEGGEGGLAQFITSDGGSVTFGVIMAVLVGAVILGGIQSIGKVTSILVPVMCIMYVLAGLFILLMNFEKVPDAITEIFAHAMNPTAVVGGLVGALIQGVKRAAFSNEAGIGSAPIAHSAVKTDKPASEGLVALLEPVVDTVVVCTMTALVIVITGEWKVDARVHANTEAPVYMAQANELEKAQISYKETMDNLPKSERAAFPLRKYMEENGEQFLLPGDTPIRIIGDPAKDENKEEWAHVYANEETAGLLAGLGADIEQVISKKLGSDGVDRHFGRGGSGEAASLYAVWLPLSNDVLSKQMDITKTSEAFGRGIGDWFPFVLTIAVVLFAFSTMLSWSYYGEQALLFLCGGEYNKPLVIGYKLVFCMVVVLGSIIGSGSAVNIGDAFLFAMVVPNLIGVYFLLPKVSESLKDFMAHAKAIDRGEKTREDID